MHHVLVTLRFTPSTIEGRVLCGPPGDMTNNLTDVTCTQGTVLDTFAIINPALVDAPPVVARDFGVGPVVPNPALGEIRLSYRLMGFVPASLELLDAGGRRVEHRSVGALGPGLHEARFDAAGRSPGVYFIRLRQGANLATARVTLLGARH
jgi:hypothetical protein